MKAEDFIELIEQNRFDKISKNGMTLIAERFRELQSKQLNLSSVSQQRELLLGFQKSEWFDLYEQGVLEYKDAIEKYLA